jgi:LysM repeat protein
MKQVSLIRTLLFLILVTSGLVACNDTDTPIVEIPAAELPTETPTPDPAISVLTATPAEVLPTTPPSPTPQSVTPPPSPTPTPHIYVVEAYDTLLGIAIEFDTTTEALMAANGLTDEDFIQIGQELIIPPSAGRAELATLDKETAPTTGSVDPSGAALDLWSATTASSPPAAEAEASDEAAEVEAASPPATPLPNCNVAP